MSMLKESRYYNLQEITIWVKTVRLEQTYATFRVDYLRAI